LLNSVAGFVLELESAALPSSLNGMISTPAASSARHRAPASREFDRTLALSHIPAVQRRKDDRVFPRIDSVPPVM